MQWWWQREPRPKPEPGDLVTSLKEELICAAVALRKTERAAQAAMRTVEGYKVDIDYHSARADRAERELAAILGRIHHDCPVGCLVSGEHIHVIVKGS